MAAPASILIGSIRGHESVRIDEAHLEDAGALLRAG